MKLKSVIRVIGGLVLAAALAGVARAGVPSESFVLTITPTGDRGVNIGSTTVGVGLTGVLGSTRTSAAIPVESTGTLGSIEYTMAASAFTGGSPSWTFSTDGSNDGLNECIVRALFKARGAAAPLDSEYTAFPSLLSTSSQDVGDTSGNFEGSGKNMDDMGLNNLADLYIRAVLPITSSNENPKLTTITITAGLAN